MSANISSEANAYITQVPALNEVADIQQALSYYHFGSATPTDYANVVAVSYANTNATSGSLVGYLKGLQVQIDGRANMASPNLTGNVTITGNTSATGNVSVTGNISGNVFISNATNGTAPFSVMSTTVVPNLTAYKVGTSQIIKINSGSTEGTDLYTFDGSSAKTLNLISGTNVSFTTSANSLTIDASETSSYPTDKTFGANVTVSSDLFVSNVIAHRVVDAGLTYSSSDNSYTINVAAGNYFTNITAQLVSGTWSYVANASTTFTTTSASLALPTVQVGDIAIVMVGANGGTVNVTTSGWTKISSISAFSFFYKQIENASTETSITITNSSSSKDTAVALSVYRNSAQSLYGTMTLSNSVYVTVASANSINPDPITTIGPNSLVITAVAISDPNATIDAAPSGYSNLITSRLNSISVALAGKVVASQATEDPGNFTDTNYDTNPYYAYTIEILGAKVPKIKLSNTSFLSSGTYKGSTYNINITGVTGTNSTSLISYDSAIKWKSNTVTAISNTTGYLNNTLKLETFDGVSFRATMDAGY